MHSCILCTKTEDWRWGTVKQGEGHVAFSFRVSFFFFNTRLPLSYILPLFVVIVIVTAKNILQYSLQFIQE